MQVLAVRVNESDIPDLIGLFVVRKAIQRPSGDQSGSAASRFQGVIRRRPVPSMRTMKIACLSLCGSYLWKAKRFPSGDHDGE
jgi:hypothetical protein